MYGETIESLQRMNILNGVVNYFSTLVSTVRSYNLMKIEIVQYYDLINAFGNNMQNINDHQLNVMHKAR